jgi:hypothetical protein
MHSWFLMSQARLSCRFGERYHGAGVVNQSRTLISALLFAATFVVALSIGLRSATACGATRFMAEMLGPVHLAMAVPRNAALIARSNLSWLSFRLREVGSDLDIPLAISCDGHFDGNLCLAYAGLLKPDTSYEWWVSSFGDQRFDAVAPQAFTTGRDEDHAPPIAQQEALTILEHTKNQPNDCGPSSSSRMRLSFSSLSEPAILALSTSIGTYRARILAVEHPEVEEVILDAPTCIVGRLIDFAGNARLVQFPCMPLLDAESSLPGMDSGQPAVSRPGTKGCAFAPGPRTDTTTPMVVTCAITAIVSWRIGRRRRLRSAG